MIDDIHKIDEELKEKIKKKYAEITLDVVEFDLGPNKIQIHSKIFKEFLRISEKETKEWFKLLCIMFLKVCHKYKIRCDPLDILILVDDEIKEINRALFVKYQSEKDGHWEGYIFIPAKGLENLNILLAFYFLHELGHCWLSLEEPKDDSHRTQIEISVDIIALCAVARISPPHKRIYREIVKHHSYIGSVGKEYLGKDSYKQIMENPELYLKSIIERLATLRGE